MTSPKLKTDYQLTHELEKPGISKDIFPSIPIAMDEWDLSQLDAWVSRLALILRL